MFSVTIGPARPRMRGQNNNQPLRQTGAMLNLARLAARHGPTLVIDDQGGAMVLGEASGDVELF